ncbi:hypothetical protein CIPAW_10G028700 [Carya illinoinensis]|uniref:Cytochrome P450 n=1 Tax=Carya illinoinensis TaxID=32201 RepID=A0A8T1P1N1_CARIL|nr:hypothetical protein CIPAW_10G028700 [Carya illinoinensis]
MNSTMPDFQNCAILLICLASICPLALPIIGHLHLLNKIPHQSLHKLSNQHGPLIYLFVGSKPCIIVSSPEMARECLKTNEFCFLNSPKMANIDYLTYGSTDFTMAPYGPCWKDQEIKQFLQLLLKKARANEAVDVGAKLIRLKNNIISRMALRKRCLENEDETNEVRKLVEEMCELAGKANVSEMIWFSGPQVCTQALMQGVWWKFMSMADELPGEPNMEVEFGCGTSQSRKRGEFGRSKFPTFCIMQNMFGAGTDTSAVTTKWAMSELINHPDVMAKVRQEIDMAIGKSKLVEESDIANLPYIQAIVKETLRLHPPDPLVVRKCTEDCIIADPNHWENPLEFWLERFLNKEGMGKSQLDVRGQHFHLRLFGIGRRSCIGATLAMQVVQTTLAVMIQCFEWNVGDGGHGSVDMEEGPGVSLPRVHPLVSVPAARLSPFPLV